MKAEHTKGPWVLVEGEKFEPEYIITTDKRLSKSIVPICGIDVYFTRKIGREQKANARLIAAAPELLEALELCYEHCRVWHPDVESNNVGKVVRAAIRKAKGEV